MRVKSDVAIQRTSLVVSAISRNASMLSGMARSPPSLDTSTCGAGGGSDGLREGGMFRILAASDVRWGVRPSWRADCPTVRIASALVLQVRRRGDQRGGIVMKAAWIGTTCTLGIIS